MEGLRNHTALCMAVHPRESVAVSSAPSATAASTSATLPDDTAAASFSFTPDWAAAREAREGGERGKGALAGSVARRGGGTE